MLFWHLTPKYVHALSLLLCSTEHLLAIWILVNFVFYRNTAGNTAGGTSVSNITSLCLIFRRRQSCYITLYMGGKARSEEQSDLIFSAGYVCDLAVME